jgi:streptogramin lyase
MFSQPSGIVVDSKGTLFVWDASNARIRRIETNGTVTTFAGGGSNPNGMGDERLLTLLLRRNGNRPP